MGIYYSRLFNVVSLEHWANLKEEDGDGGATSFGNSNPMRKYPELAKKIGTKKRGVKRLDITGPNALMKRPQIIEKFTGSNNYQAKKTYQYDKDNNLIKVWNYRNEAALALNINPSNISACCYGKRKYAGGYKWSYTQNLSFFNIFKSNIFIRNKQGTWQAFSYKTTFNRSP